MGKGKGTHRDALSIFTGELGLRVAGFVVADFIQLIRAVSTVPVTVTLEGTNDALAIGVTLEVVVRTVVSAHGFV